MTKKGKKKSKKKNTKDWMAMLSGIAVSIFLVWAYLWILDSRLPAFTNNATIKIRPNTTMEDLQVQIDSLLVPLHPGSLHRVMRLEKASERLRPGLYNIESTFTARHFVRAITRGWQDPANLVISGRLRSVEDVAKKISSQMMIEEGKMLKFLTDSLFLDQYGVTPSHVFELIIPDTYQMYWNASPKDIVFRFKKEYDAYWNEERRAAAAAQGLTPSQVSILASIVAEESHYKDEYPKIASVYLTRLRLGMKLQACPTVCYIYGYKLKRVLNKHLKVQSPYNTYIHEGLPPTPICVPGKEHLEAVLHPDSTPYKYFCADSRFNGRNVFSVTLGEHNTKAKMYRRALDQVQAGKQGQ